MTMPYYLNEFARLSACKADLLVKQFKFLMEDQDLLIKEFGPKPILTRGLSALFAEGFGWDEYNCRSQALYDMVHEREVLTPTILPPMWEIQEFIALRCAFNYVKGYLDTLRCQLEMAEGPGGHKYSHGQFALIGYGVPGQPTRIGMQQALANTPSIHIQVTQEPRNLPGKAPYGILRSNDVAQQNTEPSTQL